MSDKDDGDRVNELADQSRTIVPQPEVFAFGEFFPEVEQIDIAELGGHVGKHRSPDGAECKTLNLEVNRRVAIGIDRFPVNPGFKSG